MSDPYTVKNLTEVEDSAPEFGFEDVQEARFARGDLDAEHTGISHLRVKAGKRQAFAHRHDAAEEIYVVLPAPAASSSTTTSSRSLRATRYAWRRA